MLYEVAWNRVAGLLFGPTAATVTLTVAMVLIGLAAGSAFASAVRKREAAWLAFSQCAVAVLLLIFSGAVAVCPVWLAAQIRARSEVPLQMELLEAALLFLLLFPVATAAGMALPLTMRLLGTSRSQLLGKLYGFNAVGCIFGALISGWLLVPFFGIERTLYLGAALSGCAAILLSRVNFSGRVLGTAGVAVAALAVAALLFPMGPRSPDSGRLQICSLL
jgi:hypothetical protein